MLSIPHLIIIFLVALVVLGPEKLPQVARVMGKVMADFRRITNEFRGQIEDEMQEMERQTRIKQELAAHPEYASVQPVEAPTVPYAAGGAALGLPMEPGSTALGETAPEFDPTHIGFPPAQPDMHPAAEAGTEPAVAPPAEPSAEGAHSIPAEPHGAAPYTPEAEHSIGGGLGDTRTGAGTTGEWRGGALGETPGDLAGESSANGSHGDARNEARIEPPISPTREQHVTFRVGEDGVMSDAEVRNEGGSDFGRAGVAAGTASTDGNNAVRTAVHTESETGTEATSKPANFEKPADGNNHPD